MIVTLSPAKLMNFESPPSTQSQSTPLFSKKAEELIEELGKYSVEEISDLMDINLKQSFSVYQQIHSFNIGKTKSKQAAFAYNGIAYSGLAIDNFSEQDLNFAQKHLLILSGLYGVLRPLDMIKPYRLEMQTKLSNSCGETLYDFWSADLTKFLNQSLQKDDKIWVNLMSTEYTKVINQKLLPENTRIITPNFKEQTANGYRQVVVHTKKSEGNDGQIHPEKQNNRY
ncbi:MAG: YaaA family protein [Dysgonomonas sp.]